MSDKHVQLSHPVPHPPYTTPLKTDKISYITQNHQPQSSLRQTQRSLHSLLLKAHLQKYAFADKIAKNQPVSIFDKHSKLQMFSLKPQFEKTIDSIQVTVRYSTNQQEAVSIVLTQRRQRTTFASVQLTAQQFEKMPQRTFANLSKLYQMLCIEIDNENDSLGNIFHLIPGFLQLSFANRKLNCQLKLSAKRIDGLSDNEILAGVDRFKALKTDIERHLCASDQKMNAFMDQMRRKVEEGLKKVEALIGSSSTEATARLEKRQQQQLCQLNALFRSEVQAYMNNFACLRDEQKMSWLRMEQAQNSHKLMLDSLARQLQKTRFEIDQIDLNSNKKLKQVADKAQQDDKVLKQIIQTTLRAHAELINTTRWQLKQLKLPKDYQESNSVIQHSFSKLTQVEQDSDSDDSETQHQYRTYRYTQTTSKKEEKTRESVRQKPKPNQIRPHK